MNYENQNITVNQLCQVIDLLNPSIDDYIYVYDFQHDFYYISPHATERFLIPHNAFYDVVENHKKFVHPDDLQDLIDEFNDIKNTQRTTHNMEYRWLDSLGQSVWINCRGIIIRDHNEPSYMIGCINEIGEKQKADNISGLLGESSLHNYIQKQSLSFLQGFLLRLGIDDFRGINEKYGIEYGNMIIRKTAECISQCLKSDQKLYRIVGDEFIIVDFSNSTSKDAVELYKKIRQAIDVFVEENQYEAIYTISGGILDNNYINQCTYTDIMKYTEFALNKAKAKGKNTYVVFDIDDYQAFLKRRKITQLIRQDINQEFQHFDVFFQPVFSLKTHQLYGAEVLMRFYTEEYGSIAPVEFIPILEETGLIIPTGKWIIHQALAKCQDIQKVIPEFKISINISHIQVIKSDFLYELLSAVKEYQLDPSSVIIELTESGLLELDKSIKKVWTQLDQEGITLALDDFGTGYSNFHYLNDLKPDIIKIDRSFTAKALKNEYEYKLLLLLSQMVHHLNLKICIEGIETKEEYDKMKTLLFDYYQGFYFGKPCCYQEFIHQFVKI